MKPLNLCFQFVWFYNILCYLMLIDVWGLTCINFTIFWVSGFVSTPHIIFSIYFAKFCLFIQSIKKKLMKLERKPELIIYRHNFHYTYFVKSFRIFQKKTITIYYCYFKRYGSCAILYLILLFRPSVSWRFNNFLDHFNFSTSSRPAKHEPVYHCEYPPWSKFLIGQARNGR